MLHEFHLFALKNKIKNKQNWRTALDTHRIFMLAAMDSTHESSW